MTLKFFKQCATPNRIDKSGFLNPTGDISGVVIKQTDNTLTPDFILQTNALVYDSNYFWCDFTSRYYYITSIDVLTGGRIVIHSRVDVLFTFKNEILGSSAWVDVADSTTDTSDNYDMLHNDLPFRQDYKVMGRNEINSLFSGYSTYSGNSIVLIMK